MIAVDLDGTLLGADGQVGQRNLAALLAAEKAGIAVVIATGRRHTYALKVLRELGLHPDTLLVSSNGAVVRTFGSELIEHDHMDTETATWLCGHLGEFRNALVITFDKVGPDGEDERGALVVEELEDLHSSIGRWMIANEPYIAHVRPIEACLDSEPPIQMMLCGTVERMRRAEALMLEHEWVAAVGETRATARISLNRTEYPARDLSISRHSPRRLLQRLCAAPNRLSPRHPGLRDDGHRRQLERPLHAQNRRIPRTHGQRPRRLAADGGVQRLARHRTAPRGRSGRRHRPLHRAHLRGGCLVQLTLVGFWGVKKRTQRVARKLIGSASLLFACSPFALAMQRVTLKSGFAIDCIRQEPIGDRIRLYLVPNASASPNANPDANYLDVAANAVVSVETIPDPPPLPVIPAATAAASAEPTPTELHQLLSNAGAAHNIDAELLASVVHAESGGHAHAISRTGAQGLMQLMPGTAAAVGVHDAFVATENVEGGTRYLDQMLTRYHDNIALALAAYNAGPRRGRPLPRSHPALPRNSGLRCPRHPRVQPPQDPGPPAQLDPA